MNNTQINFLLIGILLIFIAVIGFGCHSFFSNRSAPKMQKVAGPTQLSTEWIEIAPDKPLTATGKIQFVGLKLGAVTGRTGPADEKLKLDDGTEVLIEIELIDENGRSTALFPNGIAEFVEFGKRTADKTNIENAYFQIGEKFNKIRLRSSKEIPVGEIVWMEFEF